MKTSRRIARMSRNRRKVPGLNLTSMMDVFTILLFFLMFHSGTSELLQEPKSVSLPDSVVESKPRETVVIVVGSPTSSNSNRLRELAQRLGTDAYMVDRPEDLRAEWFAGKRRVGLTAGAS